MIFLQNKKITRPKSELDVRTVLCLYVPRFQRQICKHVQICKWIPQAHFLWISRSNTCNVNGIAILGLSRIPQQANIASFSGFRNCKWIPQNVAGIRKLWTDAEFGLVLNFYMKKNELELEFLSIAIWHLTASTLSLSVESTNKY